MNSAMTSDYDVIVVGGGPAGASAAIHLSARGANVLLAEQKKFPREKLCGEFISPECLAHFERLGVAESIGRARGAQLTETVFYSRGSASVSVPSSWFGAGRALALGLSRAEMDERLLARARETGVTVLEEAHVMSPFVEGERVRGVHLKTSDGRGARTLRAPVVIDATGRARFLARHLLSAGAKRRKRASLVAFKAHLEGARVRPGNCEIYLYGGGYGGLNSIEKGLGNLCFIVSARQARAFGGDGQRLMREVLAGNRRAAETLRDARPASPWLAVALESFGRHEIVPAPGLLAVGDAASFIDPFTGSGMLMALESGELAARAITARLKELRAGGPDPFEPLAADYRSLYRERFNARLRICSLLRRAAFIPGLAETLIVALRSSETARRALARATRGKVLERVYRSQP